MADISTISLRLFTENDVQDLRTIRLEGLKAYPNMLGQPYEHAFAMTEEQWVEWTSDPKRGYFGIYDSKTVIGFMFVRIEDDKPSVARMNGLYLKREYQRQGIDRLFFETALAWAKEMGCATLFSECKETNLASKRLIEKYGGVFIKRSDEAYTFPDGSTGHWLAYSMDLT